MLFSVRDIDLLRLLRWCQYILPADLSPLCTKTELSNLADAGLLRLHKGSGALALTAQGHTLLDRLYPGKLPKATQTYHGDAISRRIRLARLTLTAYRAGLRVFTTGPEDLTAASSLFLPAITRGRGTNPWANTRIAAVAHLGESVCCFHYVCPGIGKLLLSEELAAFANNTALLKDKKQVLLFAGESYETLWAELSQSDTPSGRLISYGEAHRRSPLPVQLLACDDTGAKQLALLSVTNYREKLTRAALKGTYQPPAADLDCDATYEGHPFLMAADMDLRRIDSLCLAAKERHLPQPVLAALAGQAEGLLHTLYRDTGKARVFALTDGALEEALGEPLTLHSPANAQFLTEKGEVVDAPLIQTDRALFPHGGEE